MDKLYYCKKCDKFYFVDESQLLFNICKECATKLVSLDIDEEAWDSMTDAEKTEFKEKTRSKYAEEVQKQIQLNKEKYKTTLPLSSNATRHQNEFFKDNLDALANQRNEYNDIQALIDSNPSYEYTVVNFYDNQTGVLDTQELQDILLKYSVLGWRLKTVISNELGKNASMIAVGGIGLGTNSTLDQHVLIFERMLRPAKK